MSIFDHQCDQPNSSRKQTFPLTVDQSQQIQVASPTKPDRVVGITLETSFRNERPGNPWARFLLTSPNGR